MKKIVSLAVLLTLVLTSMILATSCGEQKKVVTLNIYNWGEYISDGSEGCLDVNAAFEEYFNTELADDYGFEVRVNYTTYASNEDMYNKIKSGVTSYDLIIPSEYMVERMIKEDLLLKLDFDNIPNFEYIDEDFRNLFYDPTNEYTVPYTYGYVGIIYNTTMVDEEDLGSWDLMWNEKYAGKILQFNNSRDAIGTAMYWKGIDVNTTDKSEWASCLELLKAQKPLVQSYVMDEIFNKMKNGSAAIAPYYSGDFLTMYEDNDALDFYYPEEGMNVFVDAMCIPKCAANKELAELYINFMLSEEPAIANAEYTYYASPNRLVYENEDYIASMEEVHENVMDILYPDREEYTTSYYNTLDRDMLVYIDSLWEELKVENSIGLWVHLTSGGIVFCLLAWLIRKVIVKKRRENKY